jgi:hypothetical protein
MQPVAVSLRVVLAIAVIAASAGCGGAVSSGDARTIPSSASLREAAHVSIYSNLGNGKNAYRCCIAWTVGGPASKIGKQWIAAPFTPSSDRTATNVRLAVTWSLGANAGLTVALARDRNGRPGSDMTTAPVPANLPAFNDCCALQGATFVPPAPLTKGV